MVIILFCISSTVIVDLTPPVSGIIVDGNETDFTNVQFSSEPASVKAQWADYSDPESGIRDYKITVYRKQDK